MRYVVIGAGAIGGVVGGLLADAGTRWRSSPAARTGRRSATAASRCAGPTAASGCGSRTAGTVTELGLRRRGRRSLLAVKSQQTAGLLDEIAALAVDGARASDVLPMLHLQNGVANEDAALRIVRPPSTASA